MRLLKLACGAAETIRENWISFLDCFFVGKPGLPFGLSKGLLGDYVTRAMHMGYGGNEKDKS